jgi:y4mF family transcriptional regulator
MLAEPKEPRIKFTDQEICLATRSNIPYDLPSGKYVMPEIQLTDTRSLGELIRTRRAALGLRQPDLALAANVGVRFIVDIENGKETCQVGLALRLLQALGIGLTAHAAPVNSLAARPAGEAGIADDGGAGRSS